MLLQRFVKVHRSSIRTVVLMAPFLFPSPSHAIPAFARMYGLSCSTCHIDFPKLNDFGKAFKDAGFKFPEDDASRIKIPPVMLGAPEIGRASCRERVLRLV